MAFCSNCGKTMRPDQDTCPHCGASMGEGRFNGSMYTSVQARIPAEELTAAPKGSMSYTRTDYMSYDNQPEPDVYSNTTYRPLLSEEEDERLSETAQEIPAEQQDEQPSAPEEEEISIGEQPSAEEDELNVAGEQEELYQEEPAQDIPAAERPMAHVPLPEVEEGRISPDIEQFMQEFDEKQARAGERRQSGRRFQMPAFLSRKPEQDEAEYEEEEYAPAEDADAQDGAQPGQDMPAEEAYDAQAYEDQPQDYDDEAPEDLQYDENGNYIPYDDGEYEGEYDEEQTRSNPLSGILASLKGALSGNLMLKRILAGVLIVAVLVCGIVWLSYVTAARSKIDGVTYDAYSKGIELVKAYATADYRAKFNDTYAVNSAYAQSMLDTDRATLTALIPAEPLENDQAFVDTLVDMQEIIADTLLMDAAAAKEGTTEERQQASDQEWKIIENSIAKLVAATNVSELSTIDSQIGAAAQPTATPAPTEPPQIYVTLKKGMNDSTAVQTMQSRLIELGYLSGMADGDFGSGTERAVMAFQEAAGLTVDGIATSVVQEALYAADAPEAPIDEPETTDTPETTDAPQS